MLNLSIKIHLLPKFHGLTIEDSHKHLKEFHIVCPTMKPHEIPEEQIKCLEYFLSPWMEQQMTTGCTILN